jgi:hypothetical protein
MLVLLLSNMVPLCGRSVFPLFTYTVDLFIHGFKDAVSTSKLNMRHCPGLCLDRMTISMKNLKQDRWCQNRQSNWVSPGYMSDVNT